MGYKLNEVTGFWEAFHSKRHPVTRQPVTLRLRRLKSRAEAVRAERDLVVKVEDRIRRRMIPDWELAVQEFLAHIKNQGFAAITIENYKVCLKAHTAELWGKRLVDDITTDQIRELVRGKEHRYAVSHQKGLLKMIRGVFKYALERGYISRNPVPQLKFRQGDKIKRVLTESQAAKLLLMAEELNCEWWPVWAMALYTGMRNGELFALGWDEVDFESNHILVNRSWNNKDGFKSTKSGDDRLVDIAPDLLTLLKELKLQSTDRVFVLPRIQKWEDGYQAEALRRFLIGIGMEPVRFHDLRASWATMLLNKGVQPARVMAMGGWKDLKTMMIYMRKAGVDIKGSASVLSLHNPDRTAAKVLNFGPGSSQ